MANTRKKRKLNTNTYTDGNLDLISNLPRHLIDCVLNRLPLHDALRTRVLSRKWRDYGATLQHLDFGYQFYQTIRNAVKNKDLEHELKHEYERIIYNTLLLHLGPLVKVNLYIPKFDPGINR